jgi:ferredoxin-type protein NapH
MCPMGFIEEMMMYIRKKTGLSHKKIPESVKSFMAKTRYVLLSAVILLSLAIAIPFLGMMALQKDLYIAGCQICPARIILPFIGNMKPIIYSFYNPITIFFSLIGIALLILFLSGFLFRRPWCRICPTGAILSLFNYISLLSKEKEVRKCTKCGICSRTCMLDNKNVYLEKKRKRISTANCIGCFRCIEKCPEKDCLKLKILGKTIYKSGSRMSKK